MPELPVGRDGGHSGLAALVSGLDFWTAVRHLGFGSAEQAGSDGHFSPRPPGGALPNAKTSERAKAGSRQATTASLLPIRRPLLFHEVLRDRKSTRLNSSHSSI